MNWKFWRKEAARKQPRKIFIPEGSRRRLLKAYDEISAAKPGQGHLARYDFWKAAADVCPEVGVGNWSAHMKAGIEPYFLEELDA